MKNQVDRTQFIITNRVRCSTNYPRAPMVYSTPMAYARRCMLTRCMSAAAICDRAAKAAQMAAVASQVAAPTSASGIVTGESGTTSVHSAAVPLALMEAAHAQLLAVTAQIESSFSVNGRQPTIEELAIAESVRAAVHSSAAYLATTEPVQAQITSAHAQLVAVTAQIERSFSDNGQQPTTQELAIAESVRAAVHSCVAYLATTEPVKA